jgi:hypothetical protein
VGWASGISKKSLMKIRLMRVPVLSKNNSNEQASACERHYIFVFLTNGWYDMRHKYETIENCVL